MANGQETVVYRCADNGRDKSESLVDAYRNVVHGSPRSGKVKFAWRRDLIRSSTSADLPGENRVLTKHNFLQLCIKQHGKPVNVFELHWFVSAK